MQGIAPVHQRDGREQQQHLHERRAQDSKAHGAFASLHSIQHVGPDVVE
jgi:hypothetical protein